MYSEHAHLNLHPSVVSEAKVHSDNHVKTVAHAVMKNIPGAKEQIDKHFSRNNWKIPYSIQPIPVVNLPFHLGW
jgi:hypothetical protein